uniref:Predicted protein n=1 Tax=Physcomitrium patens TaxID=3218 RepID=A9U2P4_PHYPA
MFVKDARPAMIEVSLAREKVWKECHYDQLLTVGAMMIPSSRSQQIQSRNVSMGNYPQMANSNVKNVMLQKSINTTPLQAIAPMTMTPYFILPTYQQSELFTNATVKDLNEALLLNLTKKMEELAVNLAKDKEKRHKPSNMRPNVWYNNCKAQGHFDTECPSPRQTGVQCTFCGGNHPTPNCWHLQRQQQFNNQTLIQPTQ